MRSSYLVYDSVEQDMTVPRFEDLLVPQTTLNAKNINAKLFELILVFP